MSDTTATRKTATLVAVILAWAAAAWFLWRTRVPADLRLPRLDPGAIFPPGELRRASRHERLLDWLWLAETVVQLAVLALVARRRIARHLRGPTLVRAGSAASLAVAAAWLATLPLHLAGHWWQRRYGITHEAYAGRLVDLLRDLAFTVVVAAVIAVVLAAVVRRFGRAVWPVVAAAVAAIGFVVVLVQPLVAPGGTRALRDPRLHAEIAGLARKEHVALPRVVVERAGQRTTLANAEAVGVGPTERVVLWDTLLDGRYSPGEIRFVAAHELAHLGRRHIWKGIAWLALLALPGAWVLTRLADLGNPAEIPRALLVVVALQLALLPVTNAVSRRYEQEADWLAVNTTHDPRAAAALFRRFAILGVARPDPPAWSHLLLDDHPTFLQRIELAEAWRIRNRAAASPAGPGSP